MQDDPVLPVAGEQPHLADAPRLLVAAGREKGLVVNVPDELTIGTEEDNDLRLAQRGVAGYHARVHREGSACLLTDLNSEEGVLVDGVYVAGSHRLQHGQRIRLGDAELVFLEHGRSLDEIAGQSSDAPLPSLSSGPRQGRRLGFGLTTGGILLLLGVLGVLGYLLGSSLLGGTAPTTQSPGPGTATGAVTRPLVGETVRVSSTPEPTPTSPRSPDDPLAQAESLALQSRFEEAITIYASHLTEEPDDPRAEAGWAMALLLAGEPEQALVHVERAAELAATDGATPDPEDATLLSTLARVYAAVGYYRRAQTVAQSAVELNDSSAAAVAVLAEIYLLEGQVERALASADEAVALDPGNADAHRVRGWIYYEEGDLEGAIGELRIAVELQFDLWLRHYELGQLLIAAENYEAAISSLMNAWVLRPKAEIAALLGRAYYGLGQLDNARPLLEYALSEGISDISTVAVLAVVEAESGRCSVANPYIRQALAQEPQNSLALVARQVCLQPPATPTAVRPSPTPVQLVPTPGPALPVGQIAFPVWNVELQQYDTYLANADGSDYRLVVEGMRQPAISPDGRWLAVNGERPDHLNLFIVRSDGSGLQEITEHTEDELPAWSPDGQSLVFSSTRHGDKQSRIYIIDQVPFEWGKAQGRPLNFGPDEVRGKSPAWVSGASIVYEGCDPISGAASCGLFLISALPGPQSPQQLTSHAGDSAPTAFGNRIAFMSDRDGNWEIYTMDAAGSSLVRVTNAEGNDGLPTWAPDGRTIAFVSDQGGVWAVWAVDPDGSNRRKLFDIGGAGLAYDWQSESISWGLRSEEPQ